ncbi:Uncharacterised protein [Yersinia intermedia]|uniref:Uncharacterized protein n=1 Tax=Yersinia intermedia TaxID=631 RepID=A0A0H5LXG9_YERIN|nr:Uncharacterised protein [Yersinia intermedia]
MLAPILVIHYQYCSAIFISTSFYAVKSSYYLRSQVTYLNA